MSGKHTLRTTFVIIGVLAVVTGCGSSRHAAAPITAAPAIFVAATVSLPSMPGAVAVDPETHKIYVATPDDNAIQVLDPDTRTIVGAIASATHPVGLQIDPARHRLYSVNYAEPNGEGGSIELIDLATEQVTATVPVGDRPMLAVDTDANVAYSISNKDFGLSVIDPEQATVTSTAEVEHDDRSGLSEMAVDPANHTLYVSDVVQHTVSSVDPNTGSSTQVAEVGEQPAALSVDPATHLLYALDLGVSQGAVWVVDPAAHAKVADIPVGYNPTAIVIDSPTHFGYVTNSDGTMSVLDLAARSLVSNVTTGRGSVGAAVDPRSHRVYVSNVAEKTLSVIEPSGRH